MTCETCTALLNEALNLVVRARQMDAIDRRENALKASKCREEWEASGRFDDYVERHNIDNLHAPTASAVNRHWITALPFVCPVTDTKPAWLTRREQPKPSG